MPESKPRVSIGLPVFNGERHIRQALDSLLAQDYEKFELVISDNASTDATQQICLEYKERDKRVSYYRNETNLGMIKNFNRVFELSSGKYFMWASHDDLWDPSFVSRCVEVLQGKPSAVLCYPQAQFIGPDGEPIERLLPFFDTRARRLDPISRFHVHIWGITYPFPIQGLIKTSALKRTRLFKEILGSDLVLLAELSLLGAFAHVPALLFYNRLPHLPGQGDRLDRVDTFTRKINKPVRTQLSALYWYLQMLYAYVQAVNMHAPDRASKAVLIPSAVLCVLVKYHWLLRSLLDVGKRNQGRA